MHSKLKHVELDLYFVREKVVAKQSCSIAEYLCDIKNVADELAIAGAPISDTELVVKIFNGLGPEYNSLSTVIQARDSLISYDDLYDKLINRELILTHRENIKSSSPITIAIAQRYASGHNAFRNNRNSQWRSQNSRPQHLQQRQPGNTQRSRVTCQLCGRPGHTANVCHSCSHNHIEAQAYYASMPLIVDSEHLIMSQLM
ncbi:hypothetical protein V6N11_076979 [Hibiscus sabdariffa]|uniref:CCHC-type domain-containing protein n=1 Tax=Hibiscus sabdariffa TaxID=183260 RepID=A0ABR2TCG4_9ROSI